MKAYKLFKPHEAHVEDVEIPQLSNKNEVLVKMERGSICGTDVELYQGTMHTKKLPITMGHEASGIVLDIEEDVKNVKKGDNVIFYETVVDFVCPECRSGKFNLCRNGGLRGRDVDGLFSEEIAVDSKLIFPVHNVNKDVVSLIQPFATVVHGQSFVKINPGDLVVVLGLGSTGLMHSALAEKKGANVIGITRSKNKLDLSSEFGVTYPINEINHPLEEVLKITGNEGASIVINTTPDPAMSKLAVKLVKRGGNIVQFGLTHKSLSLIQSDLYYKEIVMINPRASTPSDYQLAIRFVENNFINLQKLISNKYNFDEISTAVKNLSEGKEIKPVIIIN
ncbi:MAG: alcohol dehydrogenase catalytic domain-containing protein [Thermoplasmatales archaeon]